MPILSTLGSIAPYHVLLYSLVFGTTTFQSFFNGIVAFKTLPYEHFGALQAKIFPPYFAFQTGASLLLLLSPPVAFASSVVLAKNVALGAAFLGGAVNSGYLSGKTRQLMARRREQIALEGKPHNDPTASDAMKAINKDFGKIHGLSVLFNLGTFLGLVAYGVILTDGFLSTAVKAIK